MFLKLLLTFSVLIAALSTPVHGAPTNDEKAAVLNEDSKENDWGHTKNLRFYPGELFLGGLRADLLFKIKDSSWAIGPAITTRNYNWIVYSEKSNGIGITSLYSFSGDPMTHTLYLGPEILYRRGTTGFDVGFVSGQGDFQALIANLTLGYQFMWRGLGLNFGLGGNFTYAELRNVNGQFNLLGISGSGSPSGNIVAVNSFSLTADFGISIPF